MEHTKQLLNFITNSPSTFHAVAELEKMLQAKKYVQLHEKEQWQLQKGQKYYVKRNNSSIIAFNIPQNLETYHYQLCASHSDSPTFKIKDKPQLKNGGYISLNTEGYGGMIDYTWLDRPLSVAGRVVVKQDDKLVSKLVNIDRDLLMIPSVAIHMDRDVNNGKKFNHQVDMLPLLGDGELADDSFYQLLAQEADCKVEDILGMDMYLYNRTPATIWGLKQDYLACPKLDNLQNAFISTVALVNNDDPKAINVMACFDNEEVGSLTMQGAASTFLHDCLYRINAGLGYDDAHFYQAISQSFMISMDNAHATHPNHPEKTDKENCAYLNKGVVIKNNANQSYTTSAISGAIFKALCQQVDVPYQVFANRSDMRGGSTLGNLSNGQVSMHCVDVGIAQLAMHSSYECAGIKDGNSMLKVIEKYYDSNLIIHGSDEFMIK
ncbi:MAG: M18 family aminopeptidase [Erysipelotrichaceae bacterium]|nr:M18 family aminopeptidase [Erysipelotrichaceae bacterium]MDY5252851.1 M18 family aminopeptidase [Erysipelotrichaceae bacterium]